MPSNKIDVDAPYSTSTRNHNFSGRGWNSCEICELITNFVIWYSMTHTHRDPRKRWNSRRMYLPDMREFIIRFKSFLPSAGLVFEVDWQNRYVCTVLVRRSYSLRHDDWSFIIREVAITKSLRTRKYHRFEAVIKCAIRVVIRVVNTYCWHENQALCMIGPIWNSLSFGSYVVMLAAVVDFWDYLRSIVVFIHMTDQLVAAVLVAAANAEHKLIRLIP